VTTSRFVRGSLVFGFLLLMAAAFGACTVGPDYKRPPVAAPDAFRAQGAAPSTTSIGDAKWWDVFEDDALQSLIHLALQQNDDVRLAAGRVLEAQAQLGITRADQWPSVAANAGVLGERPASALGFPSRNIGAIQVQGSVAWELDFWGRYRRATEASRAQLVASEWGRRAVITSLISQVAAAYFDLRALDLELDISRRTLASRQESLRLTQVREQGGVTSLLDVRQAEQLVYGATGEIATLEREIEQQENFISLLVGNNPGAVARGRRTASAAMPC
jgi:multidrug efflux system outer membrane protein